MKLHVRSRIGSLLNNRLFGPVLVLLGLDYMASKIRNNWAGKVIDASKSLQQNMGFSEHPEIQNALAMVHEQIKVTYEQYCERGAVLDVGCGVGLYLGDFPPDIERHGVDVSADFLARAKDRVSGATFHHGDYLTIDTGRRFALIYSVGVLQYIPPSHIPDLVAKLGRDLNPGGFTFIHYPHALSEADCVNPDLTYVLYSPAFLEGQFLAEFDIVSHLHAFDSRPLNFSYDTVRYDSEMRRSVRNCGVLIARKK